MQLVLVVFIVVLIDFSDMNMKNSLQLPIQRNFVMLFKTLCYVNYIRFMRELLKKSILLQPELDKASDSMVRFNSLNQCCGMFEIVLLIRMISIYRLFGSYCTMNLKTHFLSSKE